MRPNQELLATGIATAGGAVLGGMPAGGGTSQTAVNRLAGARSQLAGLITAGATLLTLLFLAPLISLMPQATLAAVVIVYSVGLIQLPEFRAILAVRRTEFIWAVAAFAAVMLLGTLKGILVAIIISLVSLAHQVSDPPIYRLGRKRGTSVFRPLSEEHPDDEIFDGLLILRPVGRLFFANGQRVAEKVHLLVEQAQPRVAVLDLSAVFDVGVHRSQDAGRGRDTPERARHLGVARGPYPGGADGRAALAIRPGRRAGSDVLQPGRCGGHAPGHPRPGIALQRSRRAPESADPE